LVNLIALLLLSQLDHFGFATINSPQTAGTPFQITVYAYDASNNIVNFNGPAVIYASPGPQYGDTSVTFSNGVWQGYITTTLADVYSISCQDYNVPPHTGLSNSVTFNPNSPYKLLSILPGQIFLPGLESGTGGSPSDQLAGAGFMVTTYYTDRWSNIISSGSDQIRITSTDQFIPYQDYSLVNGYVQYTYAMRTAGQQYVFARDVANPSIKTDTSSLVTINPGAYSDLLVVLPGETHLPGDTTSTVIETPGKSGYANDQYEMTDFSVTVYATDSMWNRTSASGSPVQLYSHFQISNPPPETLQNGQTQFTLQFLNAGQNQNLWAEGNAISSYYNYLDILEAPDTLDTTTVVDSTFKAYPNPLGINNTTVMYIEYYLPTSCNVILAIFDPFGNLVYRDDIDAGSSGARYGTNIRAWNGRNEENKRVASGLYYLILKGWTHTATVINRQLKVGVVW
jgi:hypothetical protein